MNRTKLSIAQRFRAKVDTTAGEDSCWPWTGALRQDGYGHFNLRGCRGARRGKSGLAHRVSYELAVGGIPDGFQVDHCCHNRRCVNPRHLRVVTPSQNQQNRQGATCNSKSGIRGVHWDASKSKWFAQLGHNGQNIWLGYFGTVEEAGEAARLKRIELHTHNDVDRVNS